LPQKACKKLWVAVLDRAIKDALEEVPANESQPREFIVQGAQAWFRSQSQRVGSFLWICAVLDLHPQLVRKRLPGLPEGNRRETCTEGLTPFRND
jgi:hypothetical protein